jgi:hypothetical protein
MRILISTLLLVTTVEATAMTKKEEEPNLDPVYFLALDGNVRAAMEKLQSINPAILSDKERETRARYLERFGDKKPFLAPRHSLVDKLTAAYQSYWREVLLRSLSREEGYRYLFEQLTPIVEQLGGTIGAFSEEEYERVASFLTSALKREGYFALIGHVSPHLNFMAWKRESTKPYRVDLGDGTVQAVNVVLMEEFVSLGWAAYATFEKLHVGGWVGESSIHCVASSYDLESESFRVSFLAHEARHFADLKKYPDLRPVDLEYRAKLNELLLADESASALLKKFLQEQKENPDNPHSYASFLMMKGLSEGLAQPISLENMPTISPAWVRARAAELLNSHTANLATQ